MTEAEIAAMKTENERLKAEAIELNKKNKAREEDDKDEDDDDEEDEGEGKKKKKSSKGKKKSEEDDNDEEDEEDEDDLRGKVRRNREKEEQRSAVTKNLENALKFNFSTTEFVKANSELLPTEIPEILKAAENEKYDSAIEKASAIKRNFMNSFFSVQSNFDLLTSNQKSGWEDYKKLTHSGKIEKATEIYENLFEPALESLRRVKKAEDVGKSRGGFGSSNKVEDGYRNRLIANAKKTYLGEKGDN